jgi:conjugal transfer pilus assembly protein TraI
MSPMNLLSRVLRRRRDAEPEPALPHEYARDDEPEDDSSRWLAKSASYPVTDWGGASQCDDDDTAAGAAQDVPPKQARRPPGAPGIPMRIGEPHVRPRADETAMAEGESIPRYPPGLRGLPAVSVGDILDDQAEMLRALDAALRLPLGDFERYIRPVIYAYAAYVHLLPASETHHHRGGGGLFRHGLEVAYHAARASAGTVFTLESERYRREPAWRAGTAIAGLLHDIGKPATDLSVSDHDDTWRWRPAHQPLADALLHAGISHYYLTWTAHRHKAHERRGPLMLRHVMPPETEEWLAQADPRIYDQVLAATAGADKDGLVWRLVMTGEELSVREDLKASGYDPSAYALGVPVDRYLIDAMRERVRRGDWTCNTPGARLWHLRSGLYLVWPDATDDIRDLVAEEGIPGVPRTPETMAEVLIERGHIRTYEDGGVTHFLHELAPDALTANGKRRALRMALLASPRLIYANEPPAVVLTYEEAREARKPSAAKAQEPRIERSTAGELQPVRAQTHEPASNSEPGVSQCDMPEPAGCPDEWDQIQRDREADLAETEGVSQAEPSEAAGGDDPAQAQASRPSPSASHRDISPNTDGQRSATGQMRPSSSARTDPGPTMTQGNAAPRSTGASTPSSPADAAQAEVLDWLRQRGKVGMILRRLIALQSEADLAMDARMFVHAGHLCWPWEAGLAVLSDTEPLDALSQIHEAGLTALDPRAPGVRTREVEGQRVVMLTQAASERLRILTGPLSSGPRQSPTDAADRTAARQPTGQATRGTLPTSTEPVGAASVPAAPASRSEHRPADTSLAGQSTTAQPAGTSAFVQPASTQPDDLVDALRHAIRVGAIALPNGSLDWTLEDHITVPGDIVEQLAAAAGMKAMTYRRRMALSNAVRVQGAELVFSPSRAQVAS